MVKPEQIFQSVQVETPRVEDEKGNLIWLQTTAGLFVRNNTALESHLR